MFPSRTALGWQNLGIPPISGENFPAFYSEKLMHLQRYKPEEYERNSHGEIIIYQQRKNVNLPMFVCVHSPHMLVHTIVQWEGKSRTLYMPAKKAPTMEPHLQPSTSNFKFIFFTVPFDKKCCTFYFRYLCVFLLLLFQNCSKSLKCILLF